MYKTSQDVQYSMYIQSGNNYTRVVFSLPFSLPVSITSLIDAYRGLQNKTQARVQKSGSFAQAVPLGSNLRARVLFSCSRVQGTEVGAQNRSFFLTR